MGKIWVKTYVFIIFIFGSSLFSSDTFHLAHPKSVHSLFYKNKIFYISDQKILSKIDRFGREEWVVNVDVSGPFQILFNRIYLKTGEGQLACYSAEYGMQLWASYGKGFDSFSAGNSTIYAVSDQGNVRALDMDTGGIRWESKDMEFRSVRFVGRYNGLVAESVDGLIYKLDLSTGHATLLNALSLVNTQRVVMTRLGNKLLIVDRNYNYEVVDFSDTADMYFLEGDLFLKEKSVADLLAWVGKNSEFDSKWVVLNDFLIKQNEVSSFFVYNKDNYSLISKFNLDSAKGKIQLFFEVETKYGVLTEEFLSYLKKNDYVSKE